jgi:hypothetical protein
MTFISFFYNKTKTPAEAGVADSIATIADCPLPLRVILFYTKSLKMQEISTFVDFQIPSMQKAMF